MMPKVRTQIKRLTGSGPAPSVALFTDSIHGDYHGPIVRGAVTAAFERGSNLLCFVGGHVMPAAGPHDQDWIYALAHPTNVDGVVALSGAIVHSVGTQGFAEFCGRYREVPLCSAAIAVEGASSVCVDNEGGMRTVVEHLVRVHGLRRIAFVRGPRASDEAEVRLRAYRTVLEGAGIPYDAQLVADGDFLRASGREAVKTLLVERGLTPGRTVQAIVACNDYMALGAMDELRQRGVRLPEDIALAGFDDCAESRFVSPPLTTVRQPLEEQGHEATRIVLERIRSGGAAEQALRRTELVVRRSCGCLPAAAAATSAGSGSAGLASSFDVAFLRGRQQALAEMARAARGELGAAGPQWDSRLLSAASEQLRGDSPDAFTRAYDDMLRRLLQADTDVALCNDVLSAMRLRLIPYIADATTRTRAEDAFHEARMMTTTAVEGLYVGRRAQSRLASQAVMRAGAAIAAARDVGELQRAVSEQLPALGVERCVVLRVDPTAGGDVARVVLAERPASKDEPWPQEQAPATDALRNWVLLDEDARAFALFPVRFAGGERGLLALELGALEDSAYEVLRLFFEAALRRMSLPAA